MYGALGNIFGLGARILRFDFVCPLTNLGQMQHGILCNVASNLHDCQFLQKQPDKNIHVFNINIFLKYKKRRKGDSL